jgi:hypothetical protein
MNPESSKTEVANTISSGNKTTPKEKEAPTAETVQGAATLTRKPMTSETEQSSGVKSESVVKETTGDGIGVPPSLYQESKITPYILEMFEATQVYKQFDYEDKVNELDSFINSEVLRRELGDTKESYKKVVDELYSKVKNKDSVYIIIDQIIEWARIKQKLINVAKEKEEFESKSVDEMSSTELRRLIG